MVAEYVRAECNVGVGESDDPGCERDDELFVGDFEVWSAGVRREGVIEGSMSASDSRMRMCVAPLSGMKKTVVSRWYTAKI